MCDKCRELPLTTKQVEIDGALHTVTVCPPSPEEHDETVWPVRHTTASESRLSYDGTMTDYVMSREDNNALP